MKRFAIALILSLAALSAHAQVPMAMLFGSGGCSLVPTTISATDNNGIATLSGGNLTATNTTAGSDGLARATKSFATGKIAQEVVMSAGTPVHVGFGWANAAQAFGTFDYFGGTTNSIGFYGSGQIAQGNVVSFLDASPPAFPATYGLYWDIANNLLWETSNGTTYNTALTGTQNPSTGAGGYATSIAAGPYFPGVTLGDDTVTDTETVNYNGAFVYALPTGFSKVGTTGCAPPPPPPGGRTTLIAMFMDNSVPSAPVHNWLGFLPDINMGNQGVNPFFCAQNPAGQGAAAYPWIISVDIAQTYAWELTHNDDGSGQPWTYANVANGSKDSGIATAFSCMSASDKASIYAVRLDHEYDAWCQGQSSPCFAGAASPSLEVNAEGATVAIAAWRHMAGVIKGILPNAKIIWNPGGTSSCQPFDYSPFWPGGPGSNIDEMGTDGAYLKGDCANNSAAADFQTKIGVTQAQAATPSTYASAAAGTIAWFINFAGNQHVPFFFGEWGDVWQKAPLDGSAATGANIAAMGVIINNPANNISYHGYWNSNDCCGPGVDLSVTVGQSAFLAAFGNGGAPAATYSGTALAPYKPVPASGYPPNF